MDLTYAQKLARIRTGLAAVNAAKRKLEAEARDMLAVADTVHVDYLGKVRPAWVLGFTAEGKLDLELRDGLNVFLPLDRLVEEPTP